MEIDEDIRMDTNEHSHQNVSVSERTKYLISDKKRQKSTGKNRIR